MTFTANAGDTVNLQLSGVTTTPASQLVYVYVYRPDGGLITPNNNYEATSTSSGPVVLNLSNVPASGTYTVLVDTLYGLPATSQLELLQEGSSGIFAAPAAGQSVTFTFSATSGSNKELTLNNVNVAGASTNGFAVDVLDPSGTSIANYYCMAASAGASCTQPLWNLTAGTYTVVATPAWGGTISFSMLLKPDVVGPVLSAGTPANISLAAGQAERITFNGTQGANIALQLAAVSTTPSGQNVYAYVYRPDAGVIEATNYYASVQSTGSSSLSLSNLPVSGTYAVVMRTNTGIPATAQVSYASQ